MRSVSSTKTQWVRRNESLASMLTWLSKRAMMMEPSFRTNSNSTSRASPVSRSAGKERRNFFDEAGVSISSNERPITSPRV